MTLQKIIEEIKKVKPFAEEELSHEPTSTYSARKGRKNQAIEQLKLLKYQYTKSLLTNTLFIISVGAEKDEFAKLATESFGLFSADSETFYKDLASRVPEILYLNKDNTSGVFSVLTNHLEDKMSELDIFSYPQLLFKANYAKRINSKEEFTELVKEAINDQVGAEIVGIQAINSLVDTAIERNHADKITPIVLNVSDDKLALSLIKDLPRLTNKVFLAITGQSSDILGAVPGAISIKEVTKKSVESALKEMKKRAK